MNDAERRLLVEFDLSVTRIIGSGDLWVTEYVPEWRSEWVEVGRRD